MHMEFPGVRGGDGHTAVTITHNEQDGVEVQLNGETIKNVLSYRIVLLDGIPRLELHIALDELETDGFRIVTTYPGS